jgi:DNA-binding winged helix-turn-helix (wHTH) protein
MEAASASRQVRFGVFELDVRAGELRKHGLKIHLPDQSVKILAMLLGRPGEVVFREELRKTLWPNDTIVEFDHSINAAIKRLREALCDDADNPHFVETLPRRGYRFIASVTAMSPSPISVAPVSPPAVAGEDAAATTNPSGPGVTSDQSTLRASMAEHSGSAELIRFGLFEADLEAGELRKNGLPLKVRGQPFDVLAVLLERPGRVVTRDELRKRLWPEDTFVDFDHSLNTAINKLREALGDDADNPRFVETLPRRGLSPPNEGAHKGRRYRKSNLSPFCRSRTSPATPSSNTSPTG